jgi:preprotein translocase subunit SecB
MEAHIHAATSPLRLNRYFLKSLFFELHEGFDRGRRSIKGVDVPPLYIEVVSADQNPENSLQWRFEVSVELGEPEEGDFPYTVKAAVVGYFTVSEEYPSERSERMAKTNGPALLYSSMRELVASVTARSPYPTLLSPSMMFVPLETEELEPQHETEELELQQLPAAKKPSSKKSKPSAQKKARKSVIKK